MTTDLSMMTVSHVGDEHDTPVDDGNTAATDNHQHTHLRHQKPKFSNERSGRSITVRGRLSWLARRPQLIGTTSHSSHLNQSSSMKASTITVAQSGQCHSIRKVRLPLTHVASNIHQGLQHSHYLQHTNHSSSDGIPFGKSACHQHGLG